MKFALPWFIALILVYITYGLFLSQYNIEVLPKEIRAEDPSGFYDYRGVFNVHTSDSTGGGSTEEVIRAAQLADVDFLILTELNQTEPQRSVEGYHNKLLVFVGGEYSYLNSRLIIPSISESFQFKGAGQTQVYFADLLSQPSESRSPLMVLAHPFKHGFHWSGEYPVGLDGLEIINLKSIWQEAWLRNKISFFWTLITMPFNDQIALIRLFENPKKELELWDHLSQQRRVIGVLGADAESRIRVSDNYFLRFPSYESLFSIASNHILLRSELTGNAQADREKILNALRKGQFYFSIDLLANPKGFNTYLKDSNGRVYPMGTEVKHSPGLELVVELPNRPHVPFDIDIFKDGQKIMTSNSQNTRLVIHEAGVYRVRVRVIPTFPIPDGKKWVPWIFSNPFYIN